MGKGFFDIFSHSDLFFHVLFNNYNLFSTFYFDNNLRKRDNWKSTLVVVTRSVVGSMRLTLSEIIRGPELGHCDNV